MARQIILYIISIFFLNAPTFSQNNSLWRGYISSPNGIVEPDENICDIVKNGQLRIAPTLSNQTSYVSHFLYSDTICISRNFGYEVRFKNSSENGVLESRDMGIGFISNGRKTSVTFSGNPSGLAATNIRIADSLVVSSLPVLVTDLNQWRIAKLKIIEDTVQLTLDGVEIYRTNIEHTICNLDIIHFSAKGAGTIDWIKVFDNNNTMIWKEDFETCENFTPGIICDPFRINQSISISAPCQNDTLYVSANFPAMSYRWTSPLAERDTHQTARFPFAINGTYDLYANINRCFVFSKNFEVIVEPQTISRQEVKLCTGQTFNSPSGNDITIAGTYHDTLQNSFDCDSIVITKLSFNPIPISTQKQSICFGQAYTLPSGKVVTGSGLFRDTIRNTQGCLQIIDITLNTKESSRSSVSAKICEEQTYRLPKGKLVSTAGTYQDTFNFASGCDSIVLTTLTVMSKPQVKIETSKKGELLEGEALPLSINSISGAIYSWFENGKKISQEQPNVTATVKGGETLFKVLIKTDVCETSDSVKIIGLPAIELPNAFTPNGDNLNDYFTIVSKSNNQDIYTIENFQIFDRFGKQIYTNENGLKGWDGRLNGEDLSSDVYFYFIKIKSPGGQFFQFSGDLSLIR